MDPLERALQVLQGDHDTFRRATAAWLLGQLGGSQAVEGLLRALDDPEGMVRVIAAVALGRLKHPQAVEALRLRLHDPHLSVCYTAIRALAQIGGRPAVEALLQVWRGREDTLIRWQAEGQLGRLCAEPEQRALVQEGVQRLAQEGEWEPLCDLLRSSVPALRLWAAEVLGAIGDSRALRPLREQTRPWRNRKAPEVRQAAEQAIAAIETRWPERALCLVDAASSQSARPTGQELALAEGTVPPAGGGRELALVSPE